MLLTRRTSVLSSIISKASTKEAQVVKCDMIYNGALTIEFLNFNASTQSAPYLVNQTHCFPPLVNPKPRPLKLHYSLDNPTQPISAQI